MGTIWIHPPLFVILPLRLRRDDMGGERLPQETRSASSSGTESVAGFSSCDAASVVLATIVTMKAATRIPTAMGSPGNRSPNASMPPAIGTKFDNAEDSGI